jgi:hypothetical protein
MKSEEMSVVYGLLLQAPGMSEPVKMDMKIPRKLVLMLTQICQQTLTSGSGDKDLLALFPKEGISEVLELCNTLLDKAGLMPLSQNLKAILK